MITGTRCRCGKRRYATQAVATSELNRITAISHRPHIPIRTYLAPCGWWHLTSTPLRTYPDQQEAA